MLQADAVDTRDIDAVGDGMRTLDGLPGVVLGLAELGLLCGMPADSGGIEEHLGALQGGKARGFGVPLVPADERAHAATGEVDGLEAKIARREVIFFVIKRVVRYVHLAVDASE